MVALRNAFVKKLSLFTFLTFLLCFAAITSPPPCAGAAGVDEKTPQKPKLDVGYQPTPYEVVREMLQLADVQASDVVYDLGCGDGRIVIMAAKERGATGVGIDLDPQRIKESRENARKTGVADRVRFFPQDLFKADIRKATVVMLYLWPEVNLRLRPKLFAKLKAGTRVLSHNHDMGDWKADRISRVAKHTIYFWIIPADIGGTWSWPLQRSGGVKKAVLKLTQRFQEIEGSLTIDNKTVPVADAKLRGNQLILSAATEIEGKKVNMKLAGQAAGDTLSGTMELGGSFANGTSSWKARRDTRK